MTDIGTNNAREDELNTILGYSMVIIDHWHNTCQRRVTGYRILRRTMFSECLDWIEFMTWINEFEMFIWFYNDKIGFRMMKRTL